VVRVSQHRSLTQRIGRLPVYNAVFPPSGIWLCSVSEKSTGRPRRRRRISRPCPRRRRSGPSRIGCRPSRSALRVPCRQRRRRPRSQAARPPMLPQPRSKRRRLVSIQAPGGRGGQPAPLRRVRRPVAEAIDSLPGARCARPRPRYRHRRAGREEVGRLLSAARPPLADSRAARRWSSVHSSPDANASTTI
jgi:hypothetical protein